ncbi:MAG TPA: HAD family hydrolase [Anaerolineales bacterium]|nr:HAD family hydrolase [Anaerolineales bacterium]
MISPDMQSFPSKCPASRRMRQPATELHTCLASRGKVGLKPAVFLDRDGTINVERGYITDPKLVELYPGVGKALGDLISLGYLVVIVSNQSAIGRHLMDNEQLVRVNEKLWDLLAQSGARYDALYYCPHAPEEACECRKPKAGLILQAACDLQIDLSSSYVVGDKLLDVQAGLTIGCRTILVLTGHGEKTFQQLGMARIQPDSVQENLDGVLAYIGTNGNHN